MDPLLSRALELAEEAPSALAAVGPDGAWTRAELAERIRYHGDAWRSALEERDLDPGTVIALRVEPGPGFLAAYLACRWAGACVLLLDNSLTEEEELRVASTLGAAACWQSGAALRDDDGTHPLAWLPGRTQLPAAACLKLTSGSSGEPASVITPARSLLVDGENLIKAMGLHHSDRLFSAVPMSHSYGLSVLASPAWLLGCTVVFPGRDDSMETASEFGATFYPSVPSWYDAQLATNRELPPSLRLWLSAGAPLRSSTASAWFKQHGERIHVLYGSSECGGITYDRKGDAAVRGSVGSPLEGVRIEFDDHGHVIVHSRATALGYWPERTGRKNCLSTGRFKTEDMACMEEGELFLQGRSSQWINVKGKKVNPLEIEGVLCEHPAIRDVAVIGRTLPDGRGEAVRAVIACEEGDVSFREIVRWCQPRLASHKYPRSVVLVRELPRTGRGKLDRKALGAL